MGIISMLKEKRYADVSISAFFKAIWRNICKVIHAINSKVSKVDPFAMHLRSSVFPQIGAEIGTILFKLFLIASQVVAMLLTLFCFILCFNIANIGTFNQTAYAAPNNGQPGTPSPYVKNIGERTNFIFIDLSVASSFLDSPSSIGVGGAEDIGYGTYYGKFYVGGGLRITEMWTNTSGFGLQTQGIVQIGYNMGSPDARVGITPYITGNIGAIIPSGRSAGFMGGAGLGILIQIKKTRFALFGEFNVDFVDNTASGSPVVTGAPATAIFETLNVGLRFMI